MTPKRKLAAILFADIAGYTDRSSRDEGLALRAREGVERLVKASALIHHGRIVKMLGDGAMLEFASAVEAVSCALDIQEQMASLNVELQLEDAVSVRIGVHVGDVVEEDDDLYGNAVNIASRVHAMAQPGGVCITREVYVQIRPILKLQCAPVGGGASKRLPEEVEVFQVLGQATLPRTARRLPLALAAVAGVFATGLALWMLFASQSPARAEASTSRPSAKRLLLPDWVTPGEWFPVGGDQSLSVYFGNRPARTRMAGDTLMVQAL
ncbi:MAG TPA: adenylate/guanylate cyclase domain-containing protein, partial [Fimbriimonadaceae bacterium]|nr:adenylate/guanylate cyclase domain-containing protein [Fimbriimonadaceae bacterium]